MAGGISYHWHFSSVPCGYCLIYASVCAHPGLAGGRCSSRWFSHWTSLLAVRLAGTALRGHSPCFLSISVTGWWMKGNGNGGCWLFSPAVWALWPRLLFSWPVVWQLFFGYGCDIAIQAGLGFFWFQPEGSAPCSSWPGFSTVTAFMPRLNSPQSTWILSTGKATSTTGILGRWLIAWTFTSGCAGVGTWQ